MYTLLDRVLLTCWSMGPISPSDLLWMLIIQQYRIVPRYDLMRSIAFLESDYLVEMRHDSHLVVTPRGVARCNDLIEIKSRVWRAAEWIRTGR
jgi:hypothetical protein